HVVASNCGAEARLGRAIGRETRHGGRLLHDHRDRSRSAARGYPTPEPTPGNEAEADTASECERCGDTGNADPGSSVKDCLPCGCHRDFLSCLAAWCRIGRDTTIAVSSTAAIGKGLRRRLISSGPVP